ncbi:hypothetical protein EV401DRAFT_997183 [Pisolithus croceorrhizus]|nr:hypothetical protein EV401DRAFT_997183 [Pisolithus croceorrhizus]
MDFLHATSPNSDRISPITWGLFSGCLTLHAMVFGSMAAPLYLIIDIISKLPDPSPPQIIESEMRVLVPCMHPFPGRIAHSRRNPHHNHVFRDCTKQYMREGGALLIARTSRILSLL